MIVTILIITQFTLILHQFYHIDFTYSQIFYIIKEMTNDNKNSFFQTRIVRFTENFYFDYLIDNILCIYKIASIRFKKKNHYLNIYQVIGKYILK